MGKKVNHYFSVWSNITKREARVQLRSEHKRICPPERGNAEKALQDAKEQHRQHALATIVRKWKSHTASKTFKHWYVMTLHSQRSKLEVSFNEMVEQEKQASTKSLLEAKHAYRQHIVATLSSTRKAKMAQKTFQAWCMHTLRTQQGNLKAAFESN